MAQTKGKAKPPTRRRYSREFKQDAVQMLLDGHSAVWVAERLGLSRANMLYCWKRDAVHRAGPAVHAGSSGSMISSNRPG